MLSENKIARHLASGTFVGSIFACILFAFALAVVLNTNTKHQPKHFQKLSNINVVDSTKQITPDSTDVYFNTGFVLRTDSIWKSGDTLILN
jgi:hypothetical protein